MGERKKLGILKIENEEKVLYGDFEADFLCIDGGSLTIYGNMKIEYGVFVNCGELIVSDNLNNEGDLISMNADVSANVLISDAIRAKGGTIYGAKLVCGGIKAYGTSMDATKCHCYGGIVMVDGNLEVSYLEARNIFSNADIIVHGEAWVGNVECFNYLIDGSNRSMYIEAMKIYILGSSKSLALDAAEIFLGAEADLQGYQMTATSHFEVGGKLINCSGYRGGTLPQRKEF